eukprot:1854481-Alexandrium_andersonii.AAC.1
MSASLVGSEMCIRDRLRDGATRSSDSAPSSCTRRGGALLELREGRRSACLWWTGAVPCGARAGERVRGRLLIALPEAAAADLSCTGLAASGSESW